MNTGRPQKTLRNECIVLLHKLDPIKFTVYKLAGIFGVTKQAAHQVWQRDCRRYGFTDKKVIHTKHLTGSQGK